MVAARKEVAVHSHTETAEERILKQAPIGAKNGKRKWSFGSMQVGASVKRQCLVGRQHLCIYIGRQNFGAMGNRATNRKRLAIRRDSRTIYERR